MIIYLQMLDSEEDRSKFETLYLNYKQIMFYTANRILKDEHEAEDAVHLAFLRVIDNMDKINEEDCHKTKAFLVVITEHIAIDIYRKRKKENLISFEEVEIYVQDQNQEFGTGDSIIINAIEQLPLNYSTVLRLKFSQGYENSEIAQILEISEDNVRQRIARGRKKLSEILNNMEESNFESKH